MITISIHCFNILAAYTGQKEGTMDVCEDETLITVILRLASEKNLAFREMMVTEGKLNPHVRVFVNQQPADELRMAKPLLQGDQVMLFPAVAGGSWYGRISCED